MHFRLGQAAWDHAQDQTSRTRSRSRRFSCQRYRLQSDPHSKIDRCMTAKAERAALLPFHSHRKLTTTEQKGRKTSENRKIDSSFRVFQQSARPTPTSMVALQPAKTNDRAG